MSDSKLNSKSEMCI